MPLTWVKFRPLAEARSTNQSPSGGDEPAAGASPSREPPLQAIAAAHARQQTTDVKVGAAGFKVPGERLRGWQFRRTLMRASGFGNRVTLAQCLGLLSATPPRRLSWSS